MGADSRDPPFFFAKPADALVPPGRDAAYPQRTGNLPAPGETGCLLNEVNPSAYPPKAVVPCKTREQVMAELAEARRTGNLPADNETGCKLKDLYPDLYPKK